MPRSKHSAVHPAWLLRRLCIIRLQTHTRCACANIARPGTCHSRLSFAPADVLSRYPQHMSEQTQPGGDPSDPRNPRRPNPLSDLARAGLRWQDEIELAIERAGDRVSNPWPRTLSTSSGHIAVPTPEVEAQCQVHADEARQAEKERFAALPAKERFSLQDRERRDWKFRADQSSSKAFSAKVEHLKSLGLTPHLAKTDAIEQGINWLIDHDIDVHQLNAGEGPSL